MPPGLKSPSTASASSPWSLRDFFPGYFAMVMATGIVSVAAHLQGRDRVAIALLWFNSAAYVVLWLLTLSRLALFPERVIADLTGHARGAAFLTKVAGTCVLGTQFAVLTTWTPVAKGLWVAGIVLWLALIYAFFAGITLRATKPSLESGISGIWLLAVVSTEAVSKLGTLVAPSFSRPDLVLFISVLTFSIGAMLYVLLITLIVYRWIFFSMRDGLLPNYWINMGALAITTLAGTGLLQSTQRWEFLAYLASFFTGLTVSFWAFATWWIPILLVIGFWRHVIERVPLRYDPQYWSLVFPLGMYSAATFMLAQVAHLDFLKAVAHVFFWAGLASWALTFFGLLHDRLRAMGTVIEY